MSLPNKKQRRNKSSSPQDSPCPVCKHKFTSNGLTSHLRQSIFCGGIYSSSLRSQILSSVTNVDQHIPPIPEGTLLLSGGPLNIERVNMNNTDMMQRETTVPFHSCQPEDPSDTESQHKSYSLPCSEASGYSIGSTSQVSSPGVLDPWEWDPNDDPNDSTTPTNLHSDIHPENAVMGTTTRTPPADDVVLEERRNDIMEDFNTFKEMYSMNNEHEDNMSSSVAEQIFQAPQMNNMDQRPLSEIPPTNPIVQISHEMMSKLYSRHISHRDEVYLDLAHTLLKWRVPLYAFDDLMGWLKRSAFKSDFDPKASQKSYESFIKDLRSTMNANIPTPVTIPLEWGAKKVNSEGIEESQYPSRKVDVISFDFQKEVINLLDQEFARSSCNLVLNPEPKDWYKPYAIAPDEALNEIMTGSCYQNYIKNVWAKRPDRNNCYVKGIMLYIDGTPCDGSQRFSLEPLLFTFVDFQRKVRNQPEAWGYLGLVPNIYLSSKAGKSVAANDPKRSGESSRNFHHMLQTLLKPVLEIQDCGIPDFPVRIDDTCKLCTLLLPIFMVCADGLEADKLCIRKINYRKDCIRICSGCNCSCEDADNTDSAFKCEFLHQSEISDLCATSLSTNPETETLREKASSVLSDKLNLHKCNNAFFPFKHLGGDNHGIFGACPPCFSHVMEHGIYKRVIECFFSLLSSTVLYELDQLALIMFCKAPRQTGRRRFPRVTFTHGVTNTTKLTCKEMTGLLFTLAVITGTKRCCKLLEKRLKGKQGREDQKLSEEKKQLLHEARTMFFSSNESVGGRLTKVFSSLLCFQAWTKKKDGFWLADVENSTFSGIELREWLMAQESCTTSIKIMQHMIKTTIPRTSGNGWKNQKMHSMSHFPLFIEKFGSPRNYDCAPMECNHKTLAKDPSYQAQKRISSFLPQTSERIVDHLCIKRASERFGIIGTKVFQEDEEDEVWGIHPEVEECDIPSLERSRCPRNIITGLKMKLESKPSNILDPTSPLIFFDHWWNGSWDKLSNRPATRVATYSHDTRTLEIPGPARKYLTARNGSAIGSTFLFTEVKRLSHGILSSTGDPIYERVRCHPDYQKGGPWYDWGEFCFQQEDDDGTSVTVDIPCKVLTMFLNIQYVNGHPVHEGHALLQDLDIAETEELVELKTEVMASDGSIDVVSLVGEINAVVHCCEYPRSEKDMEQDSCLMKCWSLEYIPSVGKRKRNAAGFMSTVMEPLIREVSLSSLQKSIYVVEDYPGIARNESMDHRCVYHVSEQREWSDEFT